MRIHTSSLFCSALTVFFVGIATAQSALPLDGKWEGTLPQKRAQAVASCGNLHKLR